MDTSAKLTDDEKKSLRTILRGDYDDSDIRSSLKMLYSLLEKHYGQKAILLIDEYDVPLDKAYHHGYYDQLIHLIRAMFGAALKTKAEMHQFLHPRVPSSLVSQSTVLATITQIFLCVIFAFIGQDNQHILKRRGTA